MGVLRKPKGDAAAVEARIRAAIETLRPLLHIDACGLELIAWEAVGGVAVLRVEGECPDCAMSATTLLQGIEAHLMSRVPEIRAVRTAGASIHETNG